MLFIHSLSDGWGGGTCSAALHCPKPQDTVVLPLEKSSLKRKADKQQVSDHPSEWAMPWRRENRGGDVMDEGRGRGRGGPFPKRQQKRRNQP